MVERITLRRVKNLDELTLDMVSTPDFVLKSVDWGVVKGTHHSYKYVNQVGVTVINTSLDTRDITIEGWIVAKSESNMTYLKNVLNTFVNPQEELDLIYNTYTIRFKPDESVKYSISAAENNDVFAKFQIKGTAPNPMFSEAAEHKSQFATTIPTFHFPLILSTSLPDKGVIFGKRTASLIANTYNAGSVSIGMRIVFKANGTLTNPSLTNVNTLEEFKINKTMVAGEEIEINTNIGRKSVRGRIGNEGFVNYYMYKDIDSSWLQLEVGDNLFRYNAEEGIDNLEVFVYFNNQFLEVQECY